MFIILSFLITMFSSLGLFKQVQCPEQSHCSLSNCIFAHHSSPTDQRAKAFPLETLPSKSSDEDTLRDDRPRKRRRVADDGDAVHVGEGSPHASTGTPRRLGLMSTLSKPPRIACGRISPSPLRRSKDEKSRHSIGLNQNASTTTSIAEPKSNGGSIPAKVIIDEALNPRMITSPPAAHATRMQLLTMIHEQMVRLNTELSRSQDSLKSTLLLSPQELILEALDEEERVAKHNPAVYSNVVKLRIVKLRKMKLGEWKEERLKQVARRKTIEPSAVIASTPKDIDTSLTTSQEIAFLSKLLANQSQLSRFGYVLRVPSEEDVAKAREGVAAAQGWEQCDRCKTRFQVFPGRRAEDGALTSGGRCSYHPAKPRRPQPSHDGEKVSRDPIYACCRELVGQSSGCTQASSHVYKISDPKRLTLVMPFEATPPNLQTSIKNVAVSFDCEMGYTTMGLELIRLTATSWPTGQEVLDVLVRPLGEVLDLNSQFSGVFPEDYADAVPHDLNLTASGHAPSDETKSRLRLVESPFVARALLFSHLAPSTPLIGHALDNDLNATRIIHPSIVDSVLLYPHPRGLPLRLGLKVLTKKHLDRDIQTGGAQGHDSKEDARAAGDLVRLKVAEMWKAMKKDGWTVEGDEFHSPAPDRPA